MFTQQKLKQVLQKQLNQGRDLLDRGLDRHVRLAVTGLSGAGKTTFITGMLEQLLHGDPRRLPFWRVAREGRLRGASLSAQPDQQIPRFQYEKALATMADDPPQWPASTRSLSEIRTIVRADKKAAWYGTNRDYRDVTIDLLDYPGEWLLDLPMLQQDYAQWSAQQRELLAQPPRQQLTRQWLQQWSQTSNLNDPVADTDAAVRATAAAYRDFLQQAREQGLYLLQPGRLLLPGELENAPLLDFFPWPDEPSEQPLSAHQQGLYDILAQRFEAYKKEVVTPFFKQHFRHFNRQVLLVDVLGALRRGPQAVADLQLTLKQLLPSFQYGHNALLNRLFQPRVEKVCIVATKADVLVPEQHEQLQQLLQSIVSPILDSLRFDGIAVELHAVAAICCTQASARDAEVPAVVGWEQTETGVRQVAVRPPQLPQSITSGDFKPIAYLDFVPAVAAGAGTNGIRGEALPQLRLDAVLEFLTGDKW